MIENKRKISIYECTINNIEFVIGTMDNCCYIMDFKHRKSYNQLLAKKLSRLHAEIIFEKNDFHLLIERELQEYFNGKRIEFTFQIELIGTDFQKGVWTELQNIPYGTVISYKTLSERLKNPNAIRAVAQANGANMLAIIIPCHRVIASNGSLQGYGGGLSLKKKLLHLEKKVANPSESLTNWFY